jgi:hypothetical protein
MPSAIRFASQSKIRRSARQWLCDVAVRIQK